MKAKIKIAIIILIIFVASVLYSIVDKAGTIYNGKYDNSEYMSLELSVNNEIFQKFVCAKESLDGFAIKMTEVVGERTDDLELSYELWDVQQEKCVVQGKTDLSELKSGKFFKIKFDKLRDCKGKTFMLNLVAEGKNEQDGVIVYYTPEIEKGTEFTCGTENIDGTLVLRTITHGFDIETFVVTICFLTYIAFFMKWLYKLFA